MEQKLSKNNYENVIENLSVKANLIDDGIYLKIFNKESQMTHDDPRDSYQQRRPKSKN